MAAAESVMKVLKNGPKVELSTEPVRNNSASDCKICTPAALVSTMDRVRYNLV